MVSNSDTYINANSGAFDTNTVDTAPYGARPRYDSNALLMLPAPLAAAPQAVNRNLTSSSSTVEGPRSSEEAYDMGGSASRLKLIPTPQSTEHQTESQESTPLTPSTTRSPTFYDSPSPRTSGIMMPGPRNGPSPGLYTLEGFRSSMSSPVVYDDQVAYHEAEEPPLTPTTQRGAGRGGVRLTDSGPVPGPEGVRRVSRPSSRRPTSQVPPQNRYSRPGSTYGLPPGAAPPQPNYGS
jgi:chitin synthase